MHNKPVAAGLSVTLSLFKQEGKSCYFHHTIRASRHFVRCSALCMASPVYTKLHTSQNAAALCVMHGRDMEIRKFNEPDREDVINLWKACDLSRPWNDPNKDIDRKIQFQPDLFFVGSAGERIISSAMAGYDGHRGSVFYLAVVPDCQGFGYGHKMMEHIEKVLTKMGCPKLNIVVRSSNVRVLGFYNNLEYVKDDVVSIGKRLIPDA